MTARLNTESMARENGMKMVCTKEYMNVKYRT